MARPRTVAPDGPVKRISVSVSADYAERLEAEAQRSGRSVASFIRERLESAVLPK
jgi:predicted DNA-binding protein